MKSSVFSRCLNVFRVAADVTEPFTPEPRRLKKLDHRRWKDESVERQERRWLLIAVIAVRQDLKQAAVRWRGMVMPDHGDSDKQVE